MTKAYTDFEQSKKLAEILPIESADMYWKNGVSDKYIKCFTPFVCGDFQDGIDFDYDVPAWSLTALLSVLPSDIIRNEKTMFLTLEKAGAYNLYYKSKDRLDELWETDFEPIDACYKMILDLHELKLL